jgi:hypothetical protein
MALRFLTDDGSIFEDREKAEAHDSLITATRANETEVRRYVTEVLGLKEGAQRTRMERALVAWERHRIGLEAQQDLELPEPSI